jgi:hypothetical protein
VKDEMRKSDTLEQRVDEIESIDRKFKKFEEMCQEQQNKFESLRDEMAKLGPRKIRNVVSENYS